MSQPASSLLCDLTQSWSDVGGGVGTYLKRKRAYILEQTPHRHLMILPGPRDEVIDEGRAVTVFIASPKVPGSPHYRLLLRNGAVRAALEKCRPDLIECQDAYNLPWAAIAHRKRYPETALVAAYFTDFPTVYVKRPFAKFIGRGLADAVSRQCYRYCGALYSRFDAVYGLSENGGVAKLTEAGVDNVAVVPLGVELDEFDPSRRDMALRHSLGVGDDQPMLIYAGRLDGEKRPHVVVDAFRQLPEAMGATLVLLGDGPLRAQFSELGKTMRIVAPGFVNGRAELARWLASRRHLCFGDGRRDVRHFGDRGAGIGPARGRSRRRRDGRSRHAGHWADWARSDDAMAMARNIADVWAHQPQDMGFAAREHVRHRFAWDQSMESLFTSVYPTAFQRAAARAASPSTKILPVLADA